MSARLGNESGSMAHRRCTVGCTKKRQHFALDSVVVQKPALK